MEWFSNFAHEWADHASVLGILISVVGFLGTLIGLVRTKSASDQVARAVSDVKEKLATQSTVSDLDRLLHDIEEVRALHRAGAWNVMPSRYARLRQSIMSIKLGYPNLTRSQKTSLQGVIVQFGAIEEAVDRAIDKGFPPDDIPALNKLVGEQGDKLNAILVAVRQSTGA